MKVVTSKIDGGYLVSVEDGAGLTRNTGNVFPTREEAYVYADGIALGLRLTGLRPDNVYRCEFRPFKFVA